MEGGNQANEAHRPSPSPVYLYSLISSEKNTHSPAFTSREFLEKHIKRLGVQPVNVANREITLSQSPKKNCKIGERMRERGVKSCKFKKEKKKKKRKKKSGFI